MNEKIKSLFAARQSWQIILLATAGAVIITDLVTALISYGIWREVQLNLIVLGTINAILVPVSLLPTILRMLRQVVRLEEQNQVHQETISRFEKQIQMDAKLARRADEMSLLYQLGISLASGQDLATTLLALQTEILKLIQMDAFYVAIYDQATDVVEFPIYFVKGRFQASSARRLSEVPGLTGGVILGQRTLYLPDIARHETMTQYTPVADSDIVMHTFLGIPLLVNEKVIGVLSVQSDKVDAYSNDQIQLMENVAVQAAIAIYKARLLDRVQQELVERSRMENQIHERELILEAVAFAAEQFLKTPDWRANINTVLERLGKTLHVTHAYLFEDHLGPQGETVTSLRYEWTAPGYPSDLDGPYFQNSAIYQEGYIEQMEALSRGEARIGNSSTFNSIEKETMDALGVKAILEVPVFVNEREWGAIGFDDFERERNWSKGEVDALKIAAEILSAAIQRQGAESAVRESERIFRRAIEAADAVPYYQDYKSNSYRFMGEGIFEMTGYRAEEMRPPVWPEIVLETVMLDESVGLSLTDAGDRMRHGKIRAWKCDQKIKARDGRIRWLTDRSVELLDEQGIANGSIGILQDITSRKTAEASLRQREAILESVTFAAEQFLKAPDWRANIDHVLQRLGQTIDATHAYLFEHHPDANGNEFSSLTHEWSAAGFPSDLDNPIFQTAQPVRTDVDSTDEQLRKDEIFIGNSSTFPEIERERLRELGVKAMVEVPLFVNGAWWGTIGFDDMVNEREWSPAEVEALKIAAGILSAAIQRQSAESAVHEAERIYRQAIEAAGAVPYYRDYRTDQYTFMGAEIEKIIGYKPDEVSVELWQAIMKENIPLGEGQGLSMEDAITRSRTGASKVWKSDMRVIARNGEMRWLTDSAVELFHESDTSYASVGILQDITDRKQIEADLRKRESTLEAITFAAEQFLKAADWRDRIDLVLERIGREFNASHAYLFERRPGSHGKALSSMTYEWTAPECVSDLGNEDFQNLPPHSIGFERMDEILDGGEPLIGSSSFLNAVEREYLRTIGVKALLEIRIVVDGEHWGTIGVDEVRAEREWTPMEVDVIRVAANVLGAAIKRQRDESTLQKELDERKKLIAELKLKNAESETLRESAAIVAATLEQTEAIDRILEQLARVVPYDSASVQLLDGNVLEIVRVRGLDNPGAHIGVTFRINETEPAYPVLHENLPYVLYEDVQLSIPIFNEIPHGDIHAWMAIPLKVKGRVIGIIALDGKRVGQFSSHDANRAVTYANQVAIALENARLFSELQEELAERKKLISELENKNGELERFTYTVSHDLKSPLVTINGFLGYLEQDALSGNTERLKRDLQRISEAVRKMQNLLNELLELSRIGRVVNAAETVPFADLVREASNLVIGRLEAQRVTVDVRPDLPTVYVDKPRLVEVLQNLLDNAAKYMGDQVHPHIEVGQRGLENDLPVFYVKDNGIGIAPDFHERVFGLFNKLDPRSEGTGVGLALVRRIIEIHGGRVWVESEAGHGSTFLFTLPPSGQPTPDSVL